METAMVEAEVARPKVNLLEQYPDRIATIGGFTAPMSKLIKLCTEDLTQVSQEAMNDVVIRAGNEAGWEVDKQHEELFAESIERNGLESKISFVEGLLDTAAHANKPDEQTKVEIKQDAPTKKVIGNTIANMAERTEAKDSRYEAKAIVKNTVVTEKLSAKVPEQAKFVPVPARAVIAMLMHEQQAAVAQAKSDKSESVVVAVAAKSNDEIVVAPSRTKQEESVEQDGSISLKEVIESRRVVLLKPKSLPVKAVVHKVESTFKQVSESVVSVLREVPVPTIKVPELRSEMVSIIEAEPIIEETQLAATVVEVEGFDELAVFKVAERPLLSPAQLLDSLLAFPVDLLDNKSMDESVTGSTGENGLLLQTRERDAAEDFMPFSEQLERFVVHEVAEAEQPFILEMITDVRELIETSLSIDVVESLLAQDLVGQAELQELSQEAGVGQVNEVQAELLVLAELPISEELTIAVAELLQKMGVPEPTDRQIRQCVAKFRSEIVQAHREQIKTQKINDILHERHHLPNVRSFTQSLLSADFHKLLGQLAVYMPITS